MVEASIGAKASEATAIRTLVRLRARKSNDGITDEGKPYAALAITHALPLNRKTAQREQNSGNHRTGRRPADPFGQTAS